jgi:dTDP-4-dehydrorhamnose reductase
MKLTNTRILLTGGSGVLGKELAPLLMKEGAFLSCPKHKDMPVEDIVAVCEFVREFNPDIIIHAAAFTDVPKAEMAKHQRAVINTNIYGPDNIKHAALEAKAKVVYISTDYVYEGVNGGHKVKEPTNPSTFYGFTKLAGESSLDKKKDLIIRTAFCKRGTWGPGRKQCSGVFKDIYTSKDWVDVVAPLIIDNLKKTGILNIGTQRKSLQSLAEEDYPEVELISTDSVKLGYEYPIDSSMELSI